MYNITIDKVSVSAPPPLKFMLKSNPNVMAFGSRASEK